MIAESFAVILPAAGSGRRFGADSNKLFASLAGAPLWTHCAATFARREDVDRVIMAVSGDDEDHFREQAAAFAWRDRIEWVRGGDQRSDSVAAALASIQEQRVACVAIHDAARPLIDAADCDAVFDAAKRFGAAILATPISGTIKRGVPEAVEVTVDRRDMWIALTPQVFRMEVIRRAMQRHRGYPVTDDAQLVERMGHPVRMVEGRSSNIKVTYPEDLRVAEALLLADLDARGA